MGEAERPTDVSPIAIPYNPGYSDAIRAWAVYLWKSHRRALAWFSVFLGVDVFLVVNGVTGWTVWVDTLAAAFTATVGLFPLGFRMLWAHKIRQLGIHELELSDSHIVLRGTGLQVQSPLALYDCVIETPRYFLLTRPNGLFSFIPKQSVPADAVDRARGILHRGVTGRHTGSPGADEFSA
jgi:hypothetical protein